MEENGYLKGLSDVILTTLESGRSVRNFRTILQAKELRDHKATSIQVTLSRLHKRGYVAHTANGWKLTEKGTRKDNNLLNFISSPFKDSKVKNTILAFDIPEKNRRKRRWLREQLKIFGYELLQKSLWLGPGPLPNEFLERLEKLRIRKNVKIFTVSKRNNQ